jgi:GNAT superfamily N-acetyltransferase
MSSTIVSDLETPVLGDAPTKPFQGRFALRPMRYSDISILASMTVDAYDGTPVTKFLAPYSDKYRHDVVRTHFQHILQGFVHPKGLNLVAYEASNPNCPIGFGYFIRLNCTTWYYIQMQGLTRWALLIILTWLVWAYISVEKRLWPDRSINKEGWKTFAASSAIDKKRYWADHPERANRWQAQSVIVSPKWQGKGIGRLIMSEVIKKAQEENVIMGLQASPLGERLYRKLGFELLGDYTIRVGGDVGGGVMIWYPRGADDVKSK